MSALGFEDLKRHVGHNIECATYGYEDNKGIYHPVNVSIECMDCYEVLMDFDVED